MTRLLQSPLAGLTARELGPESEALLQRFFEANPRYCEIIFGALPRPQEAYDEMNEPLPADWTYKRQWLIGLVDSAGELRAYVNIVEDLLAQHVWHISTFIMETARHGQGDAAALFAGVEAWASENGAQWLRLGVVQDNLVAQRFWTKCGFQVMRERHGLALGNKVHTVRVMCKPLQNNTIAEYLNRVERDRPDLQTAS